MINMTDLDTRSSPSQPDSLGSGAMEESDGEVDAPGSPEHEDAPLFPLEGKYSSAQDREDLLAKPEIEREEILAERANLQLKRHQDLQLKKALATAQAANKNKRKAAAAELEDGGRRTRPKAEKTKTALDDYKRARELKGTERGRQEAGKSRKDERSPSQAGSDRDADGESEVEWAAEPANDHRHRDEPPAEMRDFERCRIGRTAFSRVCFFPGFEEAIMGCFARVSIGVNRETGQNQYRMVQIKGTSPQYGRLTLTSTDESCRLQRGQTLRSRNQQWQEVLDGRLRSRCAWCGRETMALLRVQ